MYYIMYKNGDRLEVVRKDFNTLEEAEIYKSKIIYTESFVVKKA